MNEIDYILGSHDKFFVDFKVVEKLHFNTDYKLIMARMRIPRRQFVQRKPPSLKIKESVEKYPNNLVVLIENLDERNGSIQIVYNDLEKAIKQAVIPF